MTERPLRYLHLRPEQTAPELESGVLLVILVAERAVDAAWRNQISGWIVRSGCLALVAWGVDCEEWHDCVDCANLEAFGYGDVPDESHLMTSWHDNEPLSEALWFAGNCAFHPIVALSEAIIVHVADEARASELLQAYHESQETPDDA